LYCQTKFAYGQHTQGQGYNSAIRGNATPHVGNSRDYKEAYYESRQRATFSFQFYADTEMAIRPGEYCRVGERGGIKRHIKEMNWSLVKEASVLRGPQSEEEVNK
jgi:hypothetical protein